MQQRPFAAAVGRSRAARPARAAAGQVVAAVVDGARVRVTAPIKVYHVGKFKGGLELQGLEATVVQADVRNYKHHDGNQHELSANLPIKVRCCMLRRACAAGAQAQSSAPGAIHAREAGSGCAARPSGAPADIHLLPLHCWMRSLRRSSSWFLGPRARM